MFRSIQRRQITQLRLGVGSREHISLEDLRAGRSNTECNTCGLKVRCRRCHTERVVCSMMQVLRRTEQPAVQGTMLTAASTHGSSSAAQHQQYQRQAALSGTTQLCSVLPLCNYVPQFGSITAWSTYTSGRPWHKARPGASVRRSIAPAACAMTGRLRFTCQERCDAAFLCKNNLAVL
jgi:hypothetical protein